MKPYFHSIAGSFAKTILLWTLLVNLTLSLSGMGDQWPLPGDQPPLTADQPPLTGDQPPLKADQQPASWVQPPDRTPAPGHAIPADSGFRVTDFVDLPGGWTDGKDEGWSMEFRETWYIDPERPSVIKEVEEYKPLNDALPDLPPDSLRDRFHELISAQASGDGKAGIKNITYEFVLLDPHLASSGNISFPSPEAMDPGTRALQQALISLVKSRAGAMSGFDPEEQMLSVYFHEEWKVDAAARTIIKKVRAVTPVIWQRRKTVQGEPVNDGATGYPVYYKNVLERIDLRNP